MNRILFKAGIVLVLGLSLFALAALAPVEEPWQGGTTPAVDRGEPAGQERQEIIRFRVIANSDQAVDQKVKLKVRDAVLASLKPELEAARDEEVAAAVIKRSLPRIQRAAEQTVRAQGITAPVRVSWGITDFPMKSYGPVIFPAGQYQALKIVIGEGEGKNWWCVLFPPLCYVDLTRETHRGGAEDRLRPAAGGEDDSIYLAAGGRTRTRLVRQSPVLRLKVAEWLTGRGNFLLSWLGRRDS